MLTWPRALLLLKSKPDLVTRRQPWFRQEDLLRKEVGGGREREALHTRAERTRAWFRLLFLVLQS